MEVTDKFIAMQLLDNPLIEFKTLINEKTGELTDGKQIGEYGCLKFKIFSSHRIEVSGSLHKYFNDHKHNYNDFTYTEFLKIVQDIEMKFGLPAKDLIIRNLEYGVNIICPENPTNFIKRLVVYKGKTFNRMNTFGRPGFGCELTFDEYKIKLYNKGLQYNKRQKILRFEKKILKMRDMGLGQICLADLCCLDMWLFCAENLSKTFDEIIISDDLYLEKMKNTEKKVYDFCVNPRNWEGLTKRRRIYYKYKFRALSDLYAGVSMKKRILASIIEKAHELAH